MGKKKGKKGDAIDLNSFLAAAPVAAPPPGPSSTYDRGGPSYAPRTRTFDKSQLPTGPRASLGPEEIDLSQLPSSPPYTVFLGNLAYETRVEDIEEFFASRNIACSDVRIPRSADTDRIKGFGYAELNSIAALKAALAVSNEMILNRRVRIDLSSNREEPGGRGGDRGGDRDGGGRHYEESRADGDSMWRRPADDMGFGADRPPRQNQGYGRDNHRRDDRDRPPPRESRADSDDQWRRDTAPPPSMYERNDGRGGYGRDSYDYGGPRGGGRDRDRGGYDRGGSRYQQPPPDRGGDNWRDDRPTMDRAVDRGYRSRHDNRGDRLPDRGGDNWRAPPPQSDEARPGAFSDRRDDRDRRGPSDRNIDTRNGRRGDQQEESWRRSDDGPTQSSANTSQSAPTERRKFTLAARSKPLDEIGGQGTASSNIFGSAKPVDTQSKFNEIEEKLKSKPRGVSNRGSTESSTSNTNKNEPEEPKTVSNAFAGLDIEDEDDNE